MPGFAKTNSALATMASHLDNVETKAKTLAPTLAETKKQVAEATKTFDALDSLYAQLGETQNNFSKDFQLDIERVRLGVITLSELETKWGSAVIATKDGMRTINELFAGADLGKYSQEIQTLIQDVQTGAAKLDDVVKFLKENAGDLAKGLIDVLDLFKAGKASLEDVQRVLDATKAAFPGGDSDALVEAIRNALLGGDLGGQL